jgi:hypothetical protein
VSNHILSHSETDDRGEIIAVHCSLEPFDLAFKINSHLNIKLVRTNYDISFKQTEENYMAYSNESSSEGALVFLFSNSYIKSQANKGSPLLFDQESTEHALMPELRQADYLIKYVDENSALESFIKSLSLLKEISSCYKVENSKIKSKHNLIL